MKKRIVELFTAGCPCCDDALKQVQDLICPSCDLQVLDIKNDATAQAKARQYGIKRVPAIAVDGKLADCCHAGIDMDALRAMGVGAGA